MAYYIAIAELENGKRTKENLDSLSELKDFSAKIADRGGRKIELEKYNETGLVRHGIFYYSETLDLWKLGYSTVEK